MKKKKRKHRHYKKPLPPAPRPAVNPIQQRLAVINQLKPVVEAARRVRERKAERTNEREAAE